MISHLVQRALCNAGIGSKFLKINLLLGGNRREDDQIDIFQPRYFTDDPAQLLSINIGHDEIGEDDLRRFCLQNV